MSANTIAQIILWLVFAYVFTSAIEYFPHRWVMHSRVIARKLQLAVLAEVFERHAVLHHARYFGPRSFDSCRDPAARYMSIDTGAIGTLLVTAWLWVPLFFLTHLGAYVVVVFLAAHGTCWSAVHREMHFPQRRWFARTPMFRFWRRYHEVHHRRNGTNFNVLCPFFDYVFSTYGGRTDV